VNFSTIVMVMTLFGRRRPPPEEFLPPSYGSVQTFPITSPADAAIQSFLMSSVTGLCEETVFRQFVPSVIAATTGHPSWAFVGQALLFGLGHSNPKSPPSENAIVVGLQVINGLGFGLVYLLSGGDIVPCVVAHAFYDFVTFFATWASANGQLEYAERMYQEPLSIEQERQVQELLRGARQQRLDPKLYRAIKRLFYTFDFDKNKTLSLSEVRKGVAYMALERAGTPPPQQQVDQLFLAAMEARKGSFPATGNDSGSIGKDDNRLSFADFLRLYLSMLSRATNQPTATA
jgi:Type II CAAX prenyl endopeptidase Rce1-like